MHDYSIPRKLVSGLHAGVVGEEFLPWVSMKRDPISENSRRS